MPQKRTIPASQVELWDVYNGRVVICVTKDYEHKRVGLRLRGERGIVHLFDLEQPVLIEGKQYPGQKEPS